MSLYVLVCHSLFVFACFCIFAFVCVCIVQHIHVCVGRSLYVLCVYARCPHFVIVSLSLYLFVFVGVCVSVSAYVHCNWMFLQFSTVMCYSVYILKNCCMHECMYVFVNPYM